MLVLSRKKSESILIDDTTTVTILKVRGNVVTLGIDAPDSVRIVRKEILEMPTESTKPTRKESRECLV